MILKTCDMKKEDRIKQTSYNKNRYDICEYCGTFHDGTESNNSSQYIHKYRIILCDRCVDNFDVFNGINYGSYWPIKLSLSRKMKPFIKDVKRIPKIVSYD